MQDSQSAGPHPASRRAFFFGTAKVGAAVAVVTVLTKVLEAPADAATPRALKPAPEKGGGYTLSEHVKQYYKTISA